MTIQEQAFEEIATAGVELDLHPRYVTLQIDRDLWLRCRAEWDRTHKEKSL